MGPSTANYGRKNTGNSYVISTLSQFYGDDDGGYDDDDDNVLVPDIDLLNVIKGTIKLLHLCTLYIIK